MTGHVKTADNAFGNIAASIGTTDTTIALQSGQGARFPAAGAGANGDWFYLTLIDPNSGTLEIVTVTNRSTDILTVTRGTASTAPHAFPAGSGCEARLIQNIFNTDFINAFMARDGQYAATANLNMGGFSITNLLQITDPTSPVLVGTLRNIIVGGTIIMWHGNWTTSGAALTAQGWLYCDGTNGTPDLRNVFPCGVPTGTAQSGAGGGTHSQTISVGNMPSHAHGVNDGGHNHGFNDPGHAHAVNDPGHQHSMPKNASAQAGSDNGGMPIGTDQPYYSTGRNPLPTNGAGTGISIAGSGTGCWLSASGANISIQANGGGAPFDNRPQYVGLHFLMMKPGGPPALE